MFIFAPSLILKTAPKILKKRELGKLFVLKRRNEPRGDVSPWEASDAGTGVTANIQAIRRVFIMGLTESHWDVALQSPELLRRSGWQTLRHPQEEL